MLKNKTVLITGTTRGIGKAMVREFAMNGANVIAHARRESAEFTCFIESVAEEFGVNVRPIYFDLVDYDAMKCAVRDLIQGHTPVNVLVNNAGVIHGGLFQMTPIKKIREVVEINLFAQMELIQQLLRYMIKQGGGSIVNVASVSGLDVTIANCAYGVSKAALITFTKTLAAEIGTSGVRVNALAPCLTDTDMASGIDHGARERMIERCALNRIARPEEIAKVAVFLASDSSSFVNGQVIRVDGGKGRILE